MENLIKALQIFLKYGNPNYPTHCAYDVLYIKIDPSLVSAEDKAALVLLGFNEDEDFNCFSSYRYGSA